jgi:hypothetical protein
VPRLLEADESWKAMASHNADVAPRALGATPAAAWTSGGPQRPGMWFQVELPAATRISEVHFESGATFGGGFGGFGGPQPTAAASPQAGRGIASGTPSSGATSTAPAAAAGAQTASAPAAPGSGRGPNRSLQPASVGYPRGYKVQVSTDGKTWSTPVAEGAGTGTTTVITFAPVRAKLVRITLSDAAIDAPAWSIQRLKLYQPAEAASAGSR